MGKSSRVCGDTMCVLPRMGRILGPENGHDFRPRNWAGFWAQKMGTISCPESGLGFVSENKAKFDKEFERALS